jgi:hypothetical protein
MKVLLHAFFTSTRHGNEWSASLPHQLNAEAINSDTHHIETCVGSRAEIEAAMKKKFQPCRESKSYTLIFQRIALLKVTYQNMFSIEQYYSFTISVFISSINERELVINFQSGCTNKLTCLSATGNSISRLSCRNFRTKQKIFLLLRVGFTETTQRASLKSIIHFSLQKKLALLTPWSPLLRLQTP